MKERLFVLLMSACILIPAKGFAQTTRVVDLAGGADFTSIQACINASTDGDTCLVNPGTYVENIIYSGKNIAVESASGPSVTTIDGNSSASVIQITNGESTAVITGFTILGGSAAWGGGILLNNSSSATVARCIIRDNSAGGYIGAGGGIACRYSSSVVVRDCVIKQNTTSGTWVGGAGVCSNEGASMLLENCAVIGNIDYNGWGGGIWSNRGSSITVRYCTVSANSSAHGAGGIYADWYGASVNVINSIVWGNTVGGNPAEMGAYDAFVEAIFSDVRGGWAGIGNIGADPAFVGDPDYYLSPGSPCIDSGADAGVYIDLEGIIRPQGNGFDMGAYEYTGEPQILRVGPNTAGNAGSATVSIIGYGFDPNAGAKLRRNGDEIVGSPVSFEGARITATFDLTGREPGYWDVAVVNPDGDIIKPGAFTIESGGEPNLWVDISGRDTVRLGRETSFSIDYGNSGNIDVRSAMIILSMWDYSDSGATILQQLPEPLSSEIIWVPEVMNPGSSLHGERRWTLMSPGCNHEMRVQIQGLDEAISDNPCERLSEGIALIYKRLTLTKAKHDSCLYPPYCENLYKSLVEYCKQLTDMCDVKWDQNNCGPTKPPECSMFSSICSDLEATTADSDTGLPQMLLSLDSESGFYPSWWAEQVKTICAFTSFDPNDKKQPTGYDPEGTLPEDRDYLVCSDHPYSYMVFFENLETAGAPAQDILITDQLDSSLDWSTFSLGTIQIGLTTVTVPAGIQNLSTSVDLRPEVNAFVDLQCAFNSSTGLATWVLRGRDPATGQLADFLPPNTDEVAPQGEGFVSYSVMPVEGLPTGTVINNQASIDFEIGVLPDPLDTPLVWNTIDSQAPTSIVNSLADTQTSTSFDVSWSGNDDDGGSGIKSYTIYVSNNGGPYQPWLTDTVDTSANFTGQGGHTYAFYGIAKDNVGNMEDPPEPPPDTSTYVESPGPCPGSTVASAYQTSPRYGYSDLAKHLTYFLLPVAAVIALGNWRKKR